MAGVERWGHGARQVDLRLFHGFEQRPFGPRSGKRPADQIMAGGDFVDFISI